MWNVVVKWKGQEFPVELEEEATIADLKDLLYKHTKVLPESQKLLGLKSQGRAATDHAVLASVPVKPGLKGTPEAAKVISAPEGFVDDVEDDFELNEEELLDVKDRPENLAKLQNRLKTVDVKVRNAPRPGKKLLVLDIDYTLFDHRSTVETPLELMRPYLHEFLTQAYEHYDIIIWSATSMRWLDLKMAELGVADHTNYKIVAYVDYDSCISVQTPKGVQTVKPLQTIWGRPEFSEFYNPCNTIMFDDIQRNFIMNPENGLRIRPFRQAPLNRDTDTELRDLTRYLLAIKDVPDLRTLRHNRWERYLKRH